MACQYVPVEGRSNLMAPMITWRGQREIFRVTPDLSAGAVRVAAPGIATLDLFLPLLKPTSSTSLLHSWQKPQNLLTSLTYSAFIPQNSDKEMRARTILKGHTRNPNIFVTFFFHCNFFLCNAKHGDIMFTSSMCCKIALAKHLVWQKCRGGDAEPIKVSSFLPHKMESSRTNESLFTVLY